jgi:hercynylcysteine S-oxide lyase
MTADRCPGVQIVSIPVVYPIKHADLLARFRTVLSEIKRHDGQRVLALIDGIVSNPGVIMPWEEMVRVAREFGVLSLVDGAHLIGQRPVDLKKADPDFWVSVRLPPMSERTSQAHFGTQNGHKWLFSKRASAVFYVPKRNQHLIKFTLPTSIGYVSPKDDPPASEGSERFVKLFECASSPSPSRLSLPPSSSRARADLPMQTAGRSTTCPSCPSRLRWTSARPWEGKSASPSTATTWPSRAGNGSRRCSGRK